jgi:hypothetical protein
LYPIITDTRNYLGFTQQNFANPYWSKTNININDGSTTAPDGSVTGSSFIETAVTGIHSLSVLSGITVTNTTYTGSIYLKKNLRDWCAVGLSNGVDTGYAYFNLATGTIGTVNSGVTATITSVGNGWYRCTVTRIMGVGVFNTIVINSALSDGVISYTGSTATAMFIWGAQLELGSTATTYQYVSNTSVNRTIGQFSNNLKNTTAYTYQFIFAGGWTYASTGATPNGINAYAQNLRTLATYLPQANLHIGAYSRTAITPTTNKYLWGATTTFTPYNGTIQALFTSSLIINTAVGGTSAVTGTLSSTQGLILTSGTGYFPTVGLKTYQNGVLKASGYSSNPAQLPGTSLVFDAYNNAGTISQYAPFELALVTMGYGLTDAEAAAYSTLVTTYQTALSRNVYNLYM